MKHFKLREFVKSSTAKRLGISNVPNNEEIDNIEKLVVNILDPLREAYGKPIIITSGFRCEELNRAVKGASNSQHRTGQAADIRTVEDTPEENKKLYDLIKELDLPFDQLIDEYNFNWVHVSYSNRHRRQTLKVK